MNVNGFGPRAPRSSLLYHFGPVNDNVPANFNWWTDPGSNGLNNSQANPTIDAPKPGNKQGWPAFRHMDGGIFYFADGHAKWIKRGNLQIWNFNPLASPQ